VLKVVAENCDSLIKTVAPFETQEIAVGIVPWPNMLLTSDEICHHPEINSKMKKD
jgi:hypothetical protein